MVTERDRDPLDELFERERLKGLLIMVVCFAFFTYCHDVVKMFVIERPHAFDDFRVLYSFPTELKRGVDVYIQHYSPIVFTFFTPLTRLPFEYANVFWFIVNQFALVGCIGLTALIVVRRHIRADFLLWGSLGVVFFFNQPLLENIALGQMNLILYLFILVSCLVAFDGKYAMIAGALFSVILAAKPQLGLVLCLFAWKRRWLFFGSTLTAYLVLRVIGILLYGWQIELSYWYNLVVTVPVDAGSWLHNISLRNTLLRVFNHVLPPVLSDVIYVAISLTMLVLSFRKIARHETSNFLIEFNMVLCLSLFITPHFTEPYLVFVAMPIAVAMHCLKHSKQNMLWLTTAFCLIALKYSFFQFSIFNTGFPSLVHASKLVGLFILWMLYYRCLALPTTKPSVDENCRNNRFGADDKQVVHDVMALNS